ncbi:MAG TPA: hypothetical protein VIC34_06615 [Croceibacterium sp.]
MTAKFGQARREAFLAALRETGNQTIAAERAKVSRSWVSLHRSSDPEFRRACEEAREAARARLSGAPDQVRSARGSCEPPSGWGFLDGEELVVKGTGGAGGGKRVQIARARLRQWTPRVEERFLETLAATCNVKAACAEVGLTPASAYNHRNRWARFGERWREAVETGYTQLEMGLIEQAGNLFSGEGPAEVGPIRAMTADHAIHLLHMHKHQVHGLGKRPGLRARDPDIEDVRAEILRKVAAMERADPERLARARAEWGKRRYCSAPSSPSGD